MQRKKPRLYTTAEIEQHIEFFRCDDRISKEMIAGMERLAGILSFLDSKTDDELDKYLVRTFRK